MDRVAAELDTLPPIREFEAQPITEAERQANETRPQEFEITQEDGAYFVEADFLEDILMTANMEDYESLQYFQRVLRSSGVIAQLEKMGIQEGDTVCIGGFEFDFVK